MFLIYNSFVLEKVLEKEQKNKAIYCEMALYQWQGQKDSNPRHAVLETAALPTELYPYINGFGLLTIKKYKKKYKIFFLI